MSRRGRWIGASAGALLALLVGAVVWRLRHPLEALAWSQRRALGSAGFERLELSDSGSGSDRLIYFAAGDGPPLILLHGLGDQAGTWAKVAPALVDRYRVIVPDLPGHGESVPETGELTMATIVGGAERLLERIAGDTEVSATLVGNSMGAWVATILAHRHPEQVARLVLVNGGALAGEPGGPSLQPRTRQEAAALMELLRDPSAPAIPGFVLDEIVRRARVGPTARLSRDLPGLVAHLLDGRLGEVTTPADLLWGASDRLVPLTYAERLLAALPATRLTPIERCGHVPQIECPERFREALVQVLAEPPPALTSRAPAPPSPSDAAKAAPR